MLRTVSLLQLILISLAAHLALAGSRVTTSLYALSLHASEFTVGTLIALFSLFPMFFAVPVGRLIDRVGMMRPMVCGCLSMLAGCALPGVFSGLTILYLATMLIGTGFMAIQIAAQHAVGAMSPDEKRAANFSWLALGFSVSGFSGPVLAGLIIDGLEHRIAYIAFAGSTIVALGLCSLGGLPRHVPAQQKQAALSSAFDLLRHEEMRRIYIVGILLSSAWDLFTFVLPIHGTHAGLPASMIGFILGCFSAATFAVRLAMPLISRRYSEWQVLTAALLLAALCYVTFPFVQEPLPLMLVAAVLGLAVGSSQPNMLALLHHASPPGRAGEAVGVRTMIGNACQVVLPLAFGVAGTALGMQTVFWTVGAIIGAGVPIASRRTGKSRTASP